MRVNLTAPVLLAALLCGALALVPACAGGLDGLPVDDDLDGGPDSGAGDCGDAGPDAGPCVPDRNPEAQACAALVEQSCGDICVESPGCAAAQLLATYEPERCADALADTQTFPACEAGDCDTLLTKVCGDDDRCLDAPGCPPARELQARSVDPELTQAERRDAATECLQALEDEIVFAACP